RAKDKGQKAKDQGSDPKTQLIQALGQEILATKDTKDTKNTKIEKRSTSGNDSADAISSIDSQLLFSLRALYVLRGSILRRIRPILRGDRGIELLLPLPFVLCPLSFVLCP